MQNYNKTWLTSVLTITVALTWVLVFSENARSADCSLSFTGLHGNQIYVGETVVWKLDSQLYSGHSYWYGTKNGEVDVNGLDTTLAAFFTQNFGPYQPESVGHYERFIVIKDLQNQFLCQTPAVVFDIVPAPSIAPVISASPSVTPSASPTVSPSPTQVNPAELATLKTGDLVKTATSPNVWRIKIAGEQRYKQWLFGPQVMKANGYSFAKIKIVSTEVIDLFETSHLISQHVGNGRVYLVDSMVSGVSATKRWIPTYEIFQQYNYVFPAVFYIPRSEMNLYTESANVPPPLQTQNKSGSNNLTANLSEIMLRFFGLKKP